MTANWSGNPKTWASGDLASTDMNAELRDRMDWLKAMATLHGFTSDTVRGQLKSKLVGCRALRTSSQSVATGTETAVQFNAADAYDTDDFHDPASNNTRFTFPSGWDGVFEVYWWLEWAANSTGSRRGSIVLNGSTYLDGLMGRMWNAGGQPVEHGLSNPYQFSAGDYIELNAKQNSGGALNVTSAVLAVKFEGTV